MTTTEHHTSTISRALAEKLVAATYKNAPGPIFLTPDKRRATIAQLTTIQACRGTRRHLATIPENMASKFAADEARAWDHSTLAGILWEYGVRSSRAIAWARIEQWAPHHTLTVEPITSSGGVIRWEIQTPDKTTLATSDPADKGSLHRILTDTGFKPSPTAPDTWTK